MGLHKRVARHMLIRLKLYRSLQLATRFIANLNDLPDFLRQFVVPMCCKQERFWMPLSPMRQLFRRKIY